jgi:ribosomal-protein-alanine N-acetyltransferase
VRAVRRVRDLAPTDLDWVAEQEAEIFGPAAWSRAMIEEGFHLPGERYIGVEDDGALAGYGVTSFDGEALHVLNLAVRAAARNRPQRAALLTAMVEQARAFGATEMWLEVRVDNEPAQRLYESFGFEPIRVRPRYYQPEDVDGLVMRLRLGEGSSSVSPYSEPSAAPGRGPSTPTGRPDGMTGPSR